MVFTRPKMSPRGRRDGFNARRGRRLHVAASSFLSIVFRSMSGSIRRSLPFRYSRSKALKMHWHCGTEDHGSVKAPSGYVADLSRRQEKGAAIKPRLWLTLRKVKSRKASRRLSYSRTAKFAAYP